MLINNNQDNPIILSKQKYKVVDFLKRKGIIFIAHKENPSYVTRVRVKPQDHGIKQTLLRFTCLTDTVINLQNIMSDIISNTINKSITKILFTSIQKMKSETDLFTEKIEIYLTQTDNKKD
ncbi:hypothetical protein H6G74_06310 [Nostoc spongiaeforme FACHB-130]|uniref:Uncharacterized protein n=1 Tax=Nostoc spongiaeforme FACHB-130 TaxID=1357510 RepID=A0ABR8FRR0_9NOSO|nr:hypothetical protein [Nostoc spongiaeforme]MBD2593942.1 hypothetical protein [Nostoc spongiaeforme FACHB-130]